MVVCGLQNFGENHFDWKRLPARPAPRGAHRQHPAVSRRRVGPCGEADGGFPLQPIRRRSSPRPYIFDSLVIALFRIKLLINSIRKAAMFFGDHLVVQQVALVHIAEQLPVAVEVEAHADSGTASHGRVHGMG